MNNTNLRKLIQIESFELKENGVEIVYSLFGNQHTIPAFTAKESAELLQQIDFISYHTGAGNEVAVEYEKLETLDLIQQHWSDFIKECGFDKNNALTLACYVEATKEATRQAQIFENTCDIARLTVAGLSWNEIGCWCELKWVKNNKIWAQAIRLVRENPTPERIKQLLKEIKEAAEESGGTIVHTIGERAYDYLQKLKTA